MENLLISGNTNDLTEWDIEETLYPRRSRRDYKSIITDYEWDNRISRNGFTYLEIEQLNNTFNNY